MNDTLKVRTWPGGAVEATLGARIAAGLLALAGIALLWWSLAGIVLVVTGLALVLLARPDPSPLESSHARLLQDLGLKGPGHHVPTPDGVRLFVPAAEKGPYLIPELVGAVHRDPPGSVGLALEAPGRAWLERWRDTDGLPTGQGAEEAAQHLLRALPRLGLASGVRVAQGASGMRIDMKLRDPAGAIAAEADGWHMQGGCVAQSFACGIVALALDRPVCIISSRFDAGRLHLEVVPGSTA